MKVPFGALHYGCNQKRDQRIDWCGCLADLMREEPRLRVQRLEPFVLDLEDAAHLLHEQERIGSHQHVALAVANIQETKAELDRLNVSYWSMTGINGPAAE